MTSTQLFQKDKRLQLRLSTHQKDVLSRAAKLKQTTISNFILEASYEAAQKVLVEQSLFSLSDEEWEAFCDALDAPPKDIPALRKLLTEPSVFDGE
ncbi:MAG: DUF1778 domain-containing protein [Xenococcaceae cyanobacterium]